MKRNFLSIAVFLLSALVLWIARVPTAMATNPTEVVVFSCLESGAQFGGYSVINYNNSPGAPAKSSNDCATELETLLNDGLINVNVSVQQWSTTQGAPDGGITGTYITYVLANGTLTGGNL